MQTRLRPEYDPPTVRLGAVTLRPLLTSSTGYDDNVTGTAVKHGSAVQETQLDLAAATTWSRNALVAAAQVDDVRFFDQPRQSYTNWNALLGGTAEIGRDTLTVTVQHQNLNQTPRDLNTAQLNGAIAYRVDTAAVRYTATFNRLSLGPGVQVADYSFDNGTVAGQPYLQTFRDRVVVTPDLIATYELAPQRTVVGIVRNAYATYQNRLAGQPARDYDDTTALAGIDYQFTGPFRARLLVGYEVRNFRSHAFKAIQAPVAEARVIWTPTGLTTLSATLSRQIADSADETTAGLTATQAKLAVDHELYRNVILHADAAVAVDTFGQGGGSQTLTTANAGATWLLNRNARLGLAYAFAARNGSSTGLLGFIASPTVVQGIAGNYTENRVTLQLRLGL